MLSVRFHEIPRKTYGDQIISASEVRKKYAENQLKSVCGMLPEVPGAIWKGKRMKTENKVSLEQVLWSREKRVATQKELFEKYPGTLICFMLNIPGPEKVNEFRKGHFMKEWKK